MNERETQLLKNVYRLGEEIKNLAPWESISETALLIYLRPEAEKPLLFSILGKNVSFQGVAIYVGADDYFRMQARLSRASTKDEPTFFLQNALLCQWNDREQLLKEDYERIKALGLSFRGKGAWLHFESFEIGYLPRPVNEQELLLLKEGLENLIMLLRALLQRGLSVDFDSGEAAVRFYDDENKKYTNRAYVIPGFEEPPYPNVLLKENKQIKAWKARPAADYSIEMDWSYINRPVFGEERGEFPLLLLAADASSGVVVGCELLSPRDSKTDTVFGMLGDLMNSPGKPREVRVSDKELAAVLEDFCRKLNIRLVQKKSLPKVNAARKDMVSSLI